MLVEAEISSRDLIKSLVEHHSIEYILQTIAEIYEHPAPEDLSKRLTKIFRDGIRGSEEGDSFSTYPI